MSNKLTIVFGFRERELVRVKRCLDSLQKQSYKDFKVTFVDYGSQKNLGSNVQSLIRSYSFCRYISNETQGLPWNRSHALNTGIRLSESEFTMTSDIDLIFSENFIEEVVKQLDGSVELHANAYALPKGFKNWEKLGKNKKIKFPKRNLSALGLVQVVKTNTLKEIRGFDEYYRIWGAEDEDLSNRLREKGLTIKWIDLERVPIYHQWHPSSSLRTKERIPNGWQKNLVFYLNKNKKEITRNLSHDWGKVFSSHSRKVFSLNHLSSIKENLVLDGLPVMQSVNSIYKEFYSLKSGECLKVTFTDSKLPDLQSSILNKFIRFFNRVSNRVNWPILLVNDISYFGNYDTTYDFRDMILYFILNNEDNIEDYFINCEQKECSLLLLKK